MKNTLRLEEAAMLLLSIYLYQYVSYAWWLFPALFLLPDISMMGYLVNTRVGAISYNLFHNKAIAICLYLLGLYFEMEIFQLIGLILFGHASFDRILGYGLKYPDSFHNTHLGRIGKEVKEFKV